MIVGCSKDKKSPSECGLRSVELVRNESNDECFALSIPAPNYLILVLFFLIFIFLPVLFSLMTSIWFSYAYHALDSSQISDREVGTGWTVQLVSTALSILLIPSGFFSVSLRQLPSLL